MFDVDIEDTFERSAPNSCARMLAGLPGGMLCWAGHDLRPGGARWLVQKAEGIRASIVHGSVAFENAEAAGVVLKGKLAFESAGLPDTTQTCRGYPGGVD